MSSRMTIILENLEAEELSSVDELLLAKNQLQVIDAGYQEFKLPTPEWVIDKLTSVTGEITNRIRAELQRRLRASKARRSSLRTAEEKRAGLDAEIAELENMLK